MRDGSNLLQPDSQAAVDVSMFSQGSGIGVLNQNSQQFNPNGQPASSYGAVSQLRGDQGELIHDSNRVSLEAYQREEESLQIDDVDDDMEDDYADEEESVPKYQNHVGDPNASTKISIFVGSNALPQTNLVSIPNIIQPQLNQLSYQEQNNTFRPIGQIDLGQNIRNNQDSGRSIISIQGLQAPIQIALKPIQQEMPQQETSMAIKIPMGPLYKPEPQPIQQIDQVMIPIVDNDQEMISTEHVPKKQKKAKKAKRVKGKGDLLTFYDMQKVKVTMEFDTVEKRARGQSVYTFTLKSEKDVKEILDQLKEEDLYKKYQLDLHVQAKRLNITKVAILQDSIQTELQYEYLSETLEQPQIQGKVFGNLSKDLHTFESAEKREYQQGSPLLVAKKIVQLNFKKEDLYEQLAPSYKILISFFMNSISDFGIQAVHYKLNELTSSPDGQSSTYFHTSDMFQSQQLWMPIVRGSNFLPVNWSFIYIVPNDYNVIASGHLCSKEDSMEERNRAFFHYKVKMAPAVKIGFIIGKFPVIHKMQDLTQVDKAYAFFANTDKFQIFQQSKIAEKEKLLYKILSYLQKELINAPYPFTSLKLVFVPNLFLKSSRKQSIDFTDGLHILDEELLFQNNQLEGKRGSYKALASALAFDYFGGKVYESDEEDFWLLQGIRESIGNHAMITKFGVLLYRYHIMKTIKSVYRKAKHGVERYPLYSGDGPNPSEQMLNELVYEKCELIMHMIESMIDKSYFERIIKELYAQANPVISTQLFFKIFKQVCGFKLKQFASNWIRSTSCPKLTVSYIYNKKNNSLDLTLTQESAMRNYLAFRSYAKSNADLDELLVKPFIRKDPLNTCSDTEQMKQSLNSLDAMGKFIVDLKHSAMRWFEGEVNVMLYLTDGADISTQQQKMSLKYGEDSVSINIPLSVKVKKTIQNKKKEYESMQMYDHEHEEDEDDASADQIQQRQAGGLIDNNQWKFGMNEYELEEYPIVTKNIFEVKYLESSVLWIRVDPDMEYIRQVKVKQEQNNWLFQLLLEKDIIGQIEAIRQLYKMDTQFVYEILQSVSTNEKIFYKVRKIALKYLQRMQTSKFNQYLSHEKFLIKIFNQRNFNPQTNFYKSNDFKNLPEYFFDKYLLKTIAKCKEMPLEIKADIIEQVAAQIKASTVQQSEPGTIMLSLLGTELVKLKKQSVPREKMLRLSSDQIASLFLKLLKENDNSENYFDDSCYLKQIIKSLGSLDNFKNMPEIAYEVYRQFKMDHRIGRFSSQFSVTKGAIAAFFGMKKQIHLLTQEKRKYIDKNREDINFIYEHIQATEEIIAPMDKELEKIVNDFNWPYEIRFFIVDYRIKHCFFYQGFTFMKALYLQLNQVDILQSQGRIRDCVDYARAIALFLEYEVERIDFREALLKSPKSIEIVNFLYSLLLLPFNYLDCSFTFWVKRIIYFLYGDTVPQFLIKTQDEQRIQPEITQYDPDWSLDQRMQDGNRDQFAKNRKVLHKGNSLIQLRSKNEGLDGLKYDKVDIKLNVAFPGNEQFLKNAPQSFYNHSTPGSIKISLGGSIPIDQFRQIGGSSIKIPNFQDQQRQQQQYGNDVEMINTDTSKNQQIKLMQSSSFNKNDDNKLRVDDAFVDQEDQESIYDEFAEFTFTVDWTQKIWDITGHMWYHEESEAFAEPVTQDTLGDHFDYYMSVIDYPMDLTTIKEKIKEGQYLNVAHWRTDVEVMFKNCKIFNEETSDIHKSAIKLERFYFAELRDCGLNNPQSTIRIR